MLLIHNAGEILAWPESVGAFALILNAAGISWTMSSELAGYDSINYGLWYDDAQFARVAIKHAEAARKLKAVKRSSSASAATRTRHCRSSPIAC